MPIKLRFLAQIESDQDLQDLIKLYQCEDSPLADPTNYFERYQEALTAKRDQRIAAGYFNGRIIAAFILSKGFEYRPEVAFLCVHKATRGRGVASFILQETCKQLGHKQLHLSTEQNAITQPSAQLAKDTVLKRRQQLGFEEEPEGWVFNIRKLETWEH